MNSATTLKYLNVRAMVVHAKVVNAYIASEIKKIFEAEKSYQFLLGLNDDLYSEIRGQILATKPFPL